MYGCVYYIVNCILHPKEGELRMLTSSLNARNETMSFFKQCGHGENSFDSSECKTNKRRSGTLDGRVE